MKGAITLLIALLSTTLIVAQSNVSASNSSSPPAEKHLELKMNGKSFHSDDAVEKEWLRGLFISPVELVDTKTNKTLPLTSYQVVLSLKEANTIYILNDRKKGEFKELLGKAKAQDILFVDKLVPANASAAPFSFAFYIK